MPSPLSKVHALRRTALLLFLLIPLLPAVSPAQTQDPEASDAPEPPAGSELTIYHVTMGQGDDVYEKFEHNAIWVHDPLDGTDYVYNYGLFDFNQPGYWGRFVRGDWLYALGVSDLEQTLYAYPRILNRSVRAQELNLTPAQRAELRDYLVWNARPENRDYRYDYYYDNCSTRVRDALDAVLDGRLRAATEDSLTDKTFRWHSERLIADTPAAYTGLLIGLGPGVDRRLTAWEEMFLPGKVEEQLRRLEVPDENGAMVPLVRSERVFYEADRAPMRAEPPNRLGWFALLGFGLGGAFVALAGHVRRAGSARYAFAILAMLWAAFGGLTGLLLAGLWGFTNHTIAYHNENLLQLNPLMLTLVLLAPALAFGARWAARPALWIATITAALSLLGLLLKPLPIFIQGNLPLIALTLPANLGLAWAVYRLSKERPVGHATRATRAARRRRAAAA